MSARPQEPIRMSEVEYLAFEEASEFKHEYFGGEIFAMAGANENHSLICSNLNGILYNQLRKRPCKVFGSEMRLKAEKFAFYTYPDLSIVCGDAKFTPDNTATLLNPVVLIEVLSPSTEAYDRGKKFQNYREIKSLKEYLLISQDNARIEHYLLKDDGKWELTDVKGLEANLSLPSINCFLSLEDVYEKVEFPEEAE